MEMVMILPPGNMRITIIMLDVEMAVTLNASRQPPAPINRNKKNRMG